MTPGGINIPPAAEGTGLGAKTFGDLYGDLQFAGGDTSTELKVSGSLKTVTGWAEFSKAKAEQTGHFLPIKLPDVCKGKKFTIKGRVNGDKTVTDDGSLFLVQRLENLSEPTLTIEMDGATLFTLDLTALIPVGEKAYNKDKTNFGRFGTTEALTEGFSIDWDGAKAKAHGKVKYLDSAARTDFSKLTEDGNYLPIGLSDWYGEGIPKKAGVKTIKEQTAQDIVFKLVDNSTPVTMTYLGVSVMEIDLSDVTVEPGP